MADNVRTIPAHFCAGLAQRAAVWEALPPAAQESLRSTCSELERLTVDLGEAKAQLQSLVDDIWAARFVDAAVCKTQLLQTVFPRVARHRQEQWDARRLSASAQRAASIYDLDSHLLENIIARVIAAPSEVDLGKSAEIDYVRLNKPLKSSCPHRVVAQVCRAWEVMAYASRRALALGLTRPLAPGGMAVRLIERSALSSRLLKIEVLVPESRTSCGAELATLAAVLPRCAALNTVNICLESTDPDAETTIPGEILDALPRCAALTRLKFGSNDFARLTGESAAALARMLLAVERLECLNLEGIKTGTSEDQLLPSLARHSSLQRLDCSYCLCGQGWAGLLHSTRLAQLYLENCGPCGFLPTPHEATPIDSQLADLSLLDVKLTEGDHLPLAASLAQLTKLSSLELDVVSEVIAGAIPKLPALQVLHLFCVEWGPQQWSNLCDVVRHCTRIQRLSVSISHTGSADEALAADFRGAFAAASHLKSLWISVDGSGGGGGSLVGAVLDAVPAMRQLEVLRLDGQLEFGQLCKLTVHMFRSECLQRLCLKDCVLSEDERAALKACGPQFELVFA